MHACSSSGVPRHEDVSRHRQFHHSLIATVPLPLPLLPTTNQSASRLPYLTLLQAHLHLHCQCKCDALPHDICRVLPHLCAELVHSKIHFHLHHMWSCLIVLPNVRVAGVLFHVIKRSVSCRSRKYRGAWEGVILQSASCLRVTPRSSLRTEMNFANTSFSSSENKHSSSSLDQTVLQRPKLMMNVRGMRRLQISESESVWAHRASSAARGSWSNNSRFECPPAIVPPLMMF